MIMLGGQPFAEDVVMWWNFIGRSHQEIVEFRTAWESRDPRFPPVVSRAEKVMEAPPMPTVTAQAASAEEPGRVNPVQALREIGFLLERSRADTYRVRAYRGAADAISKLSEDRAPRASGAAHLGEVSPVLGPKTATVITQAMERPGARIPAEAARGEAASGRGRTQHACCDQG